MWMSLSCFCMGRFSSVYASDLIAPLSAFKTVGSGWPKVFVMDSHTVVRWDEPILPGSDQYRAFAFSAVCLAASKSCSAS
jgi:hypothetical protein